MRNLISLLFLLIVLPAGSFGQSTLNFPKFFSAAELPYTGFAIVNPGPTTANVTFTLYAASGSLVPTAVSRYPALLPGTEQAELGNQIFSTPGASGWVQVTSTTPGLQGFWLNYNSALTDVDGAASAATAVNQTIPLVAGNTDVNIANPNPSPTAVFIQLLGSNGTQLAPQVMETISAYGVFHSDAFALFNLPVQTQVCYVRVLSGSTNPLAVTAVVQNYLVPVEDGAVNGVDESSTATQLNFPHVISGPLGSANYTTMFGVTNLSNAAQTVTLTFFTATGSSSSPVQVQLASRGMSSETVQNLFNLPANAFSNGWIQATGTAPITGFAAYAELTGGAFTVVPANPSGSTNLVFAHIANLPPWQTGIALVNPGTTAATVNIYAMTPSGTLIGGATTDPTTAVLTLAPGSKTALGLSQMIPEAGVQSATHPSDGGFVFVQSTNNVPIDGIELFYNDNVTILSNVAAGTLPTGINYTPPAPVAPPTPVMTAGPAAVVTVTDGGDSLAVGASYQLIATAVDATGTVISGQTVLWSSTNPQVLSVSSTGLVTAVSPGTATISATIENVVGSATLSAIKFVGNVSPYTFTDVGQVLGASNTGFTPGSLTGTADVSSVELPNQQIRLYFGLFTGTSGLGTIGSAISSDGTNFTAEPGTRDHSGATPQEGFASPLIFPLPGGGYRLFYSGCHQGGCGLGSSTSMDGLTFVEDPGIRFSSPLAYNNPACGGIVKTAAGEYRMYCSDVASSTVVGIATINVGAVFSAVSPDLLTWTVEPGFLIGPGAPSITEDANHPTPIVNPDGSVSLVYYQRTSNSPTAREMIATSTDGLTFNLAIDTGILGTEPSLLKRADGSILLYHGNYTSTVGSTIWRANVAVNPSASTAVKRP